MAAKKIIVFLGSTREGRMGEKVARYVGSVLEKSGMSAKIFGKHNSKKKILIPSKETSN